MPQASAATFPRHGLEDSRRRTTHRFCTRELVPTQLPVHAYKTSAATDPPIWGFADGRGGVFVLVNSGRALGVHKYKTDSGQLIKPQLDGSGIDKEMYV